MVRLGLDEWPNRPLTAGSVSSTNSGQRRRLRGSPRRLWPCVYPANGTKTIRVFRGDRLGSRKDIRFLARKAHDRLDLSAGLAVGNRQVY